MVSRLWAFTRHAFDRYTAHRLEFMASLGLMILGLWIMFTPAPLSYAFLLTLAPQWAWGGAFFLVGFVARIGILRDSVPLRQAGVLGIFLCRMFLLGAVVWGTKGTSNTIPEHISWALVCIWAYFRLDVSE